MRRPLASLFALLALLVPALAGCGGDDDSPGEIVTDIVETVEGEVDTLQDELEDELDGED